MPIPFIDRLSGRARKSPPIGRWLSIVEMALLALLAVQAARLVWAIVTPVGSFGEWHGRRAIIPSPAAREALLAHFDPFFRAASMGGGNAVVTSLALSLYGVRVNEGSGQGAAIIATPDGAQGSFAMGDEILPGVTLKSVAFDHVTIDRGGVVETLFLDQSGGAPVADPQGDDEAPVGMRGVPPEGPVVREASGPRRDPGVSAIRSDIAFAPRLQNGKVTGLVLTSRGPAFAEAGFQEGDVIAQVNGRPIGSVADLQALQSQIAPGARISLSVERGAAVVPIALTPQGQ